MLITITTTINPNLASAVSQVLLELFRCINSLNPQHKLNEVATIITPFYRGGN